MGRGNYSESEDDDGTILMSNVHHNRPDTTNREGETTEDEEDQLLGEAITTDEEGGQGNSYGSIPINSPSTNDTNTTSNSGPSKGFYIIVSSFIATCIIGLVFFKPTNIFPTTKTTKSNSAPTNSVSSAPSSLATSLSTSSTSLLASVPSKSSSSSSSSSSTSSSTTTATTTTSENNKKQHETHVENIMNSMPYPIVNRATYNDPLSKIFLPNIFHPSLLHPTSDTTTTSSSSTTTTTAFTTTKSSPPAPPYLKVPFPTGAFWTNLILHPTSDHSLSYPIVSYPYSYKWSTSFLQLSYPYLQRFQDDTSIRDSFKPDLIFGSKESVTKRNVMGFDLLSVALRFFTSSSSSSSTTTIDSEGESTTTTSSSYWETYIVQGAPYTTIQYKQTTPVITPISIFRDVECLGNGLSSEEEDNSMEGICKVLYEPPPNRTPKDSTNKLISGTQFLLHTNEDLYWIVFASQPLTLSFDTITKRTITAANSTYTGTLRFALVPPPNGSTSGGGFQNAKEVAESTGVKQLVYHSSVYPIGGDVFWDFSNTQSGSSSGRNNVGTITFNYNVKSMTTTSSSTTTSTSTTITTTSKTKKSNLLMLSLPHHSTKLPSDILLTSEFDLEYNCIKGKMTPVVGNKWTYDELLTNVDFDDSEMKSALLPAANFDEGVKKEILKQIKQDLYRVLPTLDENVYGFGKQVARLAQLVHIARRMNQVSTSTTNTTEEEEEGIVEEGAELLYSFLSKFLANDERDKLVYDANLGGMVTMDGLKNTEADFGNGRYNDHHFHYGYILYACAIMGNMNTTFVSNYGKFVDPILFDVAHNSYTGSNAEPMDGAFFPLARHISWFDGHSFASGLFPFGNGKSQESSSEAVNCYYGAYLWSMVRSESDEDFFGEQADKDELLDFTRLLLATEIRGAKTYWHMIPPTSSSSSSSGGSLENVPAVYTPRLAKNYMVGNLGMMDVTCSTWFGTEPLYVHMINFIPITAITSELFDRTYVQEEYNNLIKGYHEVEMAWRGYVVCDEALVDPNSAWKKANDIYSPELDSALSRSQVLYWISTRKGFVPPSQNATSSGESSSSSSISSGSSALCYKNEKCAEQGLTGECCPASNGVYLGCCDSSSSSTNSGGSTTTASSSYCSQNEKCAAMGLEGECCPAPGGVFLGCCDATTSSSSPSPSSSSTQTNASEVKASTNSSSISSSASCDLNEKCAATGLTGDCCPSSSGVYLGCCDATKSSSSTQTKVTTDQQASSSSSCSQNEKCAASGLQGECCPAPGGVYLGCCDEQR